ncbi:MAG: hypothetical protein IT441_01840 [Phycisphaeraceae bacterium]|nr:hypothetical protein [Phycisphaeraceae bacterium]
MNKTTPLLLGLIVMLGCSPKVRIEPIKVEPIHITMDINLRVDRELDDFFSYQKPSPAVTMPSSDVTQ